MGFVWLTVLSIILILSNDNDVVSGFSCSTATRCRYNNSVGAGRRSNKSFIVKASSADDDNNPSNEESLSLDMNILRQRMDHQQNQYAKLIMEQSRYIEQETNLPESVHIILFNPETPNQNIHTLEIPKGSGNDMILAFEDGADCGMFAQNLRELEFVDPSPSETMFEPFAEFCESMSIPVLVVPAGFDLSPPQSNSNDGDEEDEDVMSVEDALDSISTLLDQEEDSVATTVIVDDEIDSWG
ncbi:hypothetical protein QTG54_012278 [Skeletonema marinoi]|uniref:Uncharacterized protein n=1 Tax=Skeletonema marinoi TaxID=267567 RepID=A0AAD8Y0C8_9STRA|nr:hypothetical protein QTG54_012278 [Skeletonema marinoi]